MSNTKFSACVYGDSGVGKSSMAKLMIDYIRLSLPEAKAKIYTVEHSTVYETCIRAGKAILWNLNSRQTPFETIDAASQGGWPKDVDDPKSPIVWPTPDDLKEYPIRIFEGLATFSDLMGGGQVSGGLASRGGRGERIGPAEETVKFVDGSVSVGGNPRSHYNVVQTYIRSAVGKSHILPTFNLWTSHEVKAKDDKTGLPIVGPEVFGPKATQHVSRWFANLIRLSSSPEVKKTKEGDVLESRYKLWIKNHFDPAYPGLVFKAKNCVDIEKQHLVPVSYEGGAFAIGKFMDLLREHGQLTL